MTVDVANYFAQLDNQKGKLERWETDIFQLYHAGVSYQNIADFLKLNGAESTKMEVHRFIHRKKRRHLLESKPVSPAETVTRRKNVPKPVEKDAGPPSSEPEQLPKPEHQESSSRPKFKFRESLDKDKTKW